MVECDEVVGLIFTIHFFKKRIKSHFYMDFWFYMSFNHPKIGEHPVISDHFRKMSRKNAILYPLKMPSYQKCHAVTTFFKAQNYRKFSKN